MRPPVFAALLLVASISGCVDTARSFTVENRSGDPIQLTATMVEADGGKVVVDETVAIEQAASASFEFGPIRSGDYLLTIEADNGLHTTWTLEWHGRTGPTSIEFTVHSDRIEGRITVV